MTLACRTEEDHPLLAVFGLASGRWARLNRNVDAEDEMLIQFLNLSGQDREQALVLYFDSGRRIWETMSAALRWRFGDRPFQLLDFASGYGRMTRFAVLDVPPERLWVADIYAGGVRFQAEQLGVHGLVSHADPARFECAEIFDAILVSSLFTHLPEDTFRAWLRRLHGLLRPGGMLVFSVHGEDLLPPGRSLDSAGIFFDPRSESGSLPGEQYGTTWVDAAFVRRMLAEAAPGAAVHCIPRGLVNFQDLWIVVAEPACDFSGLRLNVGPELFVEHCSAPAGQRLRMVGWVTDRVLGRPPRELRVRIAGEIRHIHRDFSPRPDVGALFPYEQVTGYGWSFEVPLPGGLGEDAPLAIEGVDAAGEISELYAGTLLAALLRSTRLGIHTLEARLRERDAELAREGERIAGLHGMIRGLEARIDAMQASRFWKLRNAWFGVKRRLGWTRE